MNDNVPNETTPSTMGTLPHTQTGLVVDAAPSVESATTTPIIDAGDAATDVDLETDPEPIVKTGLSRHAWQALGFTSLGLGTLGIFLPLLPTVGFYVFAAYCFTRSNPVWEAKLLNHPQFGPHIRAWRDKGAISRKGKIAATLAFAVSIGIGLLTLHMPYVLIPPAVAVVILSWLLTRPEW